MPFVSGVAGYLVYRYIDKVDAHFDKIELKLIELRSSMDKIKDDLYVTKISTASVKDELPKITASIADLKLDVAETKSSLGYLRDEIAAVVRDNAKFKVAYGKIIKILGSITKSN